MKNRLLLLAATAILASCGRGNENAKPNEGDPPAQIDYGHTPIALQEANKVIQNYHNYADSIGDTPRVFAFMLEADKLRTYLNSDSSLVKLDVYLARTDAGEMKLVYIGARNTGTADNPMYTEIPYIKDGEQYMFDHGIPCPTCDRDPLHHPQTTAQ